MCVYSLGMTSACVTAPGLFCQVLSSPVEGLCWDITQSQWKPPRWL